MATVIYLSIYGYHFFVSTSCPVWLDLTQRLKNKSNEPQGLFSGGARMFDFGTYGSVTQRRLSPACHANK